MSRKMLLALGCGLVALFSGAALRISLSDESIILGEPPAEEELDAFRDIDRPSNANALRQRFVELSSKRARRMSDQELGKAIEEITKELGDQDAAAETELGKAIEQLRAVVERFPGTPSAERAGRALETVRAKPPTPITPRTRFDEDVNDQEDSANRSGLRRTILPVKKQGQR